MTQLFILQKCRVYIGSAVYKHLDYVLIAENLEITYLTLVNNAVTSRTFDNESRFRSADTRILVNKQMLYLFCGISVYNTVFKSYFTRHRHTSDVALGITLITPSGSPCNEKRPSQVILEYLTCVLVGTAVERCGMLYREYIVFEISEHYREIGVSLDRTNRCSEKEAVFRLHKGRTLCKFALSPLAHNTYIVPVQKILALVKKKSCCAGFTMPRSDDTIILTVNTAEGRITEIGTSVSGALSYYRVPLIFFEVYTVGGIGDTYRFKYSVVPLRVAYRCIEEIKSIVLDYCSARPASLYIVIFLGSESCGELFPVKKILGSCVSPMHMLQKRTLEIGGILIKHVIIAIEIHKAVRIIEPAGSGSVMIL